MGREDEFTEREEMSYDNTNTGMMYRNDRKEKDTHPDFQGFINVDGVEYWLSGWTKEGKPGSKMEGRKFFSLSIKPKDERKSHGNTSAPPDDKKSHDGFCSDLESDIPF